MPTQIRKSNEGLSVVTYLGNGHEQAVGPNSNTGIPASFITNTIGQSLRFRASNSARLTRTMSTPTNNLKWTVSLWVKFTNALATSSGLFGGGSAANYFVVNRGLSIPGELEIIEVATTTVVDKYTKKAFFTPNEWLHLVIVWDTANGTAEDRAIMYVNGNRILAADYFTNTTPSASRASFFNASGTNYIGCRYVPDLFLDGYLTHVAMVDGQALTPSAFGYQNPYANKWMPNSASEIRSNVLAGGGTRNGWGTNGFFLMMNDIPSAIQVYDRSQSDTDTTGNNWTCTGISATAGADYDWVPDTPTCNYPTVDPAPALTYFTLSKGALSLVHTSTASADGTVLTHRVPSSGKYYIEVTCPSGSTGSISAHLGILSDGLATNLDPQPNVVGYWGFRIDFTLRLCINGIETTTTYTVPVNGVLQMAIDCDNKRIYFGTDNTWRTPANITGAAFNADNYAYYGDLTDKRIVLGGIRAVTFDVNCGQRTFSFTPPTGFVAFNSQNMPAIDDQSFDVDLAIIKNRDAAQDWVWVDRVRGIDNWLASNAVAAEASDYNVVDPLVTKRGCVYVGNNAKVNTINQKYVAYLFKAGNKSQSIAAGAYGATPTLTSTVRANPRTGVSIITWTGNNANASIAHGLPTAPKFVIVKNRATATYNWHAWHTGLTDGTYFLKFNGQDAQAVDTTSWNSAIPTSQIINLGSAVQTNNSGLMIAYAFAEVPGFSKFGTYLGNGIVDGPVINCGFRPAMVILKNRTTGGSSWRIVDSKRYNGNPCGSTIFPNQNLVEQANGVSYYVDFLANGFKLRGTGIGENSAETFVYAAFAEFPSGDHFVTPASSR